jgi:Ser/Thr protein kinase RdoA (MazF antagonist)
VTDAPGTAERHAAAAGCAFVPGTQAPGPERFGTGHIHDTFVLRAGPPGGRVLLQRINERVFPEPLLVVENVGRICEHLRARLQASGAEAERRCLRPLPTTEGSLAHLDPEGGVWRAFAFIERTLTHDTVDAPALAREAARAFGAFAAALGDLAPVPPEPLPGFHDFSRRVAEFEAALAEDAYGRREAAARDMEALQRTRERLEQALAQGDLAAVPRRVVHNDCKINNVLFDAESGEGLCVIDLDTVMEGTLLLDFGDLVRTASCRAPEDESDVARMRPDLPLFEALCEGYLTGAAPLMTPQEVEWLALAGPLITLETALRFATDHLRGDSYFRVTRPDHNRVRARAQGALAQHLLEGEGALREIVARLARRVL